MTPEAWALAGVVLGGLLTQGFNSWNRSAQWRRDDQHRFAEERRVLYGRFAAACNRLCDAKSHQEHVSLMREGMDVLQEVALVGGIEIRGAALEMYRANEARFLTRIQGDVASTRANEQRMERAHAAFFVAARRELGVEDLD